jgi:Amt family ammonium transporter
VGGILGTIMVAFLGAEGVLGGLGLSVKNPETGETYSSMEQLIIQLKSVGITVVWSAVATIIIVTLIKKTVGLRVSEEVEAEGLDSAEHGETAYNFDA